MKGFVDETFIDISSGKGGAGCVSFRREKYVPNGGPDGGDGGKGGSVVFVVRRNLKTLVDLKAKRVFKAQNGRPGEGRKKHGKDGQDIIIPVPPGTLIKNFETDELIKDLADETEWVFLKGGKGGKGNWHFSTSTRQAPRYAQPGLSGEEMRIRVELNIIADIGFVGLPNAGKSSLLSILTNASPKVASYAFTTKIPNLGVMGGGYKDVVLADIPGIIEGASQGVGLGFKFLRHISRTSALAIMIDLSDENYHETFDVLMNELKEFAEPLVEKKRIIIGTKTDLDVDETALEGLKKALPNEKVIGISSFSREGIEPLKQLLLEYAH